MMSRRFRICLAAWVATIAVTLLCGQSFAESVDVGNGWTMQITPALKIAANDKGDQPYEPTGGINIQPGNTDAPEILPAPPADAPADDGSQEICATSVGHNYRSIYNSIPFDRSLFNANPMYRHDATMEILTGNPRPQTIIRQAAPAGPRLPILPYGYHLDFNSRFRSMSYFNSPFLYGNGFRGLW